MAGRARILAPRHVRYAHDPQGAWGGLLLNQTAARRVPRPPPGPPDSPQNTHIRFNDQQVPEAQQSADLALAQQSMPVEPYGNHESMADFVTDDLDPLIEWVQCEDPESAGRLCMGKLAAPRRVASPVTPELGVDRYISIEY